MSGDPKSIWDGVHQVVEVSTFPEALEDLDALVLRAGLARVALFAWAGLHSFAQMRIRHEISRSLKLPEHGLEADALCGLLNRLREADEAF